MESFYILIIAVVLAGAVVGFLAGFLRIVLLFIKAGIAVTAFYFLQPFIADITNGELPLSTEWMDAILFFTFFVLIFMITHWLLKPLTNKTRTLNRTLFSRTSGSLAGAICLFTAGLFFTQSTNVVETPALVKTEMKALGVDETLTIYPGELWNNDRTGQQKSVQVMSSEAPGEIVENGVLLSFTVKDYVQRSELADKMLLLVNQERKKYGFKPFSADTVMQAAALNHAADMFNRGYFSHNTPEGVDPFERLHKMKIRYNYAGENLAIAPTLIKAHEGLMRSPGHRANILNPAYKRIGIAVLDGGTHGLMITQEFRD